MHGTEMLRECPAASIRAWLFSSVRVTVFCFPKKFWKLPKLLQFKNKAIKFIHESSG